MAIKFTYMDHNFWRISDRDASKLAKASPLGRLPKIGHELSIDMGDGKLGWLQRTQNLYGQPRSKRGWVWAVYYTGKLNPPKKREHKDVFAHHQIKIAKQTLNMPDAMVGVMGGPDKAESRAILKKYGVKYKENPRKKARRKK